MTSLQIKDILDETVFSLNPESGEYFCRQIDPQTGLPFPNRFVRMIQPEKGRFIPTGVATFLDESSLATVIYKLLFRWEIRIERINDDESHVLIFLKREQRGIHLIRTDCVPGFVQGLRAAFGT